MRLVAGPGAGPDQARLVVLPFGAEVGLAVLQRGEDLLILADQARELDLAPLARDPVLRRAQARVLPGGTGTLVSLPLVDPAAVEARRQDGAWILRLLPRPARQDGTAGDGFTLSVEPGMEAGGGPAAQLLLRGAAARPGQVLALTDPETSLPLLVGTVRGPGAAVEHPRRLPGADLLPTRLGLAVLARSDRIVLRAAPGADGFSLSAAGDGMALALDGSVAAPAAAPAALTRAFDIPALPVPQLAQRLRAEQAAIAAAPPLARGELRRAAAATLLALGLPQEAQGMLALALAEDPRAGADPVTAALSGAAALLAARPQDSSGLEHPALPHRDEVALWRALRSVALSGPGTESAAPIVAGLPIALGYPEALRARLLPMLAEALAADGRRGALRRVLDAAGARPDLALASGILAEAEGQVEEALAAYDAAAAGRDRRARARALRRALELRLASGRIDAREAARALEASLYAWRGDGEERQARLRLAALRAEAGDGPAALALLRETAVLFPEHAAELLPAQQAAFVAALASAPALEAAAMFEANPELLPSDDRREQAVLALAERLAGLDLPDHATVLLRRALDGAAAGPARAAIGLRLAALRLAEGDAPGSLAALRDTAPAGAAAATGAEPLPAELARERAVLAARAESRRGNRAAALAHLQPLGAEGLEATAEILAEGRDWQGAARALDAHLRAALPPAPAPLREPDRRALLRQAALLALAGDAEGIAALRAAHGARMAAGPLGESFAALTADPLRGLADLPRLQRELQLFRSFPSGLEPLRAASLGTR